MASHSINGSPANRIWVSGNQELGDVGEEGKKRSALVTRSNLVRECVTRVEAGKIV